MRVRDANCEKLTSEIGEIDDKLLIMIKENDDLRAQLGLDERDNEEIAILRRNMGLQS